MPFVSTKTYGHEIGLSCAFRQWRAESHCKYLHGYAISVRLEFETDDADLDIRNWVVDFGSLKSFKHQLESIFDHKTLVAEDDPKLPMFEVMDREGMIQLMRVEHTGCEAFAKAIYDLARYWLKENGYAPRVRMRSVEVREHGANSAIYIGGDARAV